MRKRYSFLLTIIALIGVIIVLEYFSEDEKQVLELPISEVINFEYIDENTEIRINLLEINSKKKCAKMINNEIRNIFEKRVNQYIENKNDFIGKYVVASEYSLNQNLLSIKIYETDSNLQGSAGNIYAVVYDIRNDIEINLSTLMSDNKLDYNEELKKAENYINNKNTTLNVYFPYFYLNKKGNIELIARSMIQVSKFEYWNNIEIYEIVKDIENEANEASIAE